MVSKIWQCFEFDWDFIRFSNLAEDVIIDFSNVLFMVLKSSKLLLDVSWQFLAKWISLTKGKPLPPQHAYTWICSGLELMSHDDVWFWMLPCLVFYCLTFNQHAIFICKCTLDILFLLFLETTILGSVTTSLGIHINSLLCFHLWMCTSKTLNFLSALQLFIFWQA